MCAIHLHPPPIDAVEVVRRKLSADPTLADRTPLSVKDICELLELCLNSTYFVFNKIYYKQQYGCAMGSPVSRIVVNLYMEEFERKALDSFTGQGARIWLRYVDDTFVVVNESEKSQFFEHLNEVDIDIKFTEECSSNNKLAFPDCLILRELDGPLVLRSIGSPPIQTITFYLSRTTL